MCGFGTPFKESLTRLARFKPDSIDGNPDPAVALFDIVSRQHRLSEGATLRIQSKDTHGRHPYARGHVH
jgi:hypothetical protein